MKIEKQKVIAITSLIIITLLFYNLFVMPQSKQLKAIRLQYISEKELLSIRETKKKELEALKNVDQDFKAKLYAIENRFLNEDKINSFLKTLNLLAINTENKLKTIDPIEREALFGAGIEEVFVKVAIVGRYPSIINFLKMLTTHEKLLRITDLKIKKERDEDQDLGASFVLTLFTIKSES